MKKEEDAKRLCRYHLTYPEKIAYKPETCWICEYYSHWIPRKNGTNFGNNMKPLILTALILAFWVGFFVFMYYLFVYAALINLWLRP